LKFWLFLAGVLFMAQPVLAQSSAVSGGDDVVLLHGIGRTSDCMSKLQTALELQGYRVLNIDYPSRQDTISNLADQMEEQIKAFSADKSRKLHFVGFSMGGLVARAYIHRHRPENLGRVVLMGTPNQGSEVADFLDGFPLFDWFYGPAGKELTTAFNRDAVFGVPDYPVGVIAGTWTVDPVSYYIIPGANDGKVSVDRTTVEGMADKTVLPVTHAFMPLNATVIAATLAFLKEGAFPKLKKQPVTGAQFNN